MSRSTDATSGSKVSAKSRSVARSLVRPHFSVVIPVYGCAESLVELHRRLTAILSSIAPRFEILLVNDGSPDESWTIIECLARQDSRVVGISLSRNFSQHRAILAGLDMANGENVIVMDCDLQDQPESILDLYNKRREGYEIVVGVRANRQDSFPKKLGSRLFTVFFNFMTNTDFNTEESNFTLFSRNVLTNLRKLREQNAFFALNLRWLGFDTAYVPIEHGKRELGQSSYSLLALFSLASDCIISHSNKPLKLMIGFGFVLSLLSLLLAISLIIKYFIFEHPVAGWTSVMVSIYLIGGLMFAFMGLLGLYVGKSFDEQKHRPLYVIKEIVAQPDKNVRTKSRS